MSRTGTPLFFLFLIPLNIEIESVLKLKLNVETQYKKINSRRVSKELFQGFVGIVLGFSWGVFVGI